MHARKLPVVLLLLVSVTACGGGEPVAAPVEPAPATALQPVAPEDDEGIEGYVDYWSPAAVASLEAAKASYVPPPEKSAETANSAPAATATTTTTLTTAPTQTAPQLSPSPAVSPSPSPSPTPTPTYSPAPYQPDPTRPEATEPTVIFVQVLDCAPDAQIGWTRVDYILYLEGTDGWTIHREDNMRPHAVATSTSELVTATDEDPQATVVTDPEETHWAFRAESSTLESRFAVPYHEDVLLRSPEGVVTPVPAIGFLIPRNLCKLG